VDSDSRECTAQCIPAHPDTTIGGFNEIVYRSTEVELHATNEQGACLRVVFPLGIWWDFLNTAWATRRRGG